MGLQCPNCGDDPPWVESVGGVVAPDETVTCSCGAVLIMDLWDADDGDGPSAHVIWSNEEEMEDDRVNNEANAANDARREVRP